MEQAKNIDLNELRLLDDQALIDFILSRFHARHTEQLDELIRDAQKVVEVHSDDVLCPRALLGALVDVRDDLMSHMMKEEQILFPMISRGMGAQAVGPISVMQSEHVSHNAAIQHLEALTDSSRMPDDACGTWRRLFAGVGELTEDLKAHIHIENEILFARQSA